MHSAPPSAAAPDLPYLISFPRTGSHWLRFFLELYFDRPLLTRWFFPHESEDFLLLHRHDRDGREITDRRDTLYLYRSIVNTIFSEATYLHQHRAPDLVWAEIAEIARLYREHLRKWLLREDVARRRSVIAYEWLLDRPFNVLPEVIRFFGAEPDTGRIAEIWPQVTHASVESRTGHEPRVIAADRAVQLRRDVFRYRFSERILDLFREDDELLETVDRRLLV